MRDRRRSAVAAAAGLAAALVAALVAASGFGSHTRVWTWDTPDAVPGSPLSRPVGSPTAGPLKQLAAAGDLVLIAGARGDAIAIGATANRTVELAPIDEAAGADPVVAYVAPSGTASVQEVVGVARTDVDRVEAVMADGRIAALPLNEWRAFSYTADTPADVAATVVAYAATTVVGAVALPQTTTSSAAAPKKGYTISNRGRRVAPRAGVTTRLFNGRSYQMYLLGTLDGRAFYRLQLSPHYTCWGTGQASLIGEIGSLGCPRVVGAYPLQSEDTARRSDPRGQGPLQLLRADGVVVDQAVTMALVDTAGKQIETTPVVNNLYSFPGPYPKQFDDFVRVVALDANGTPLKPHPEWGEQQTPPEGLFGPRATPVNPAIAGAPVQRGDADGVRVSADARGVVVFDSADIDARHKKLVSGRQVGFNCFYIEAQNFRKIWAAGLSRPWEKRIAFKVLKRTPPAFDGCEIQGSYGHRWHDQYGPHTAVEVPLTERGRRYFDARATARDLALFVRSGRTQRIRKLGGVALIVALKEAYGHSVAMLSSPTATAPAGVVGVNTGGGRTVFSERSVGGIRFFVELENGKIKQENVRGLAFVF
jgi:hypothetical protein